MKRNEGFTLIELLAVIIILGVIMIIAIPSITQQINNSRKLSYSETARRIIGGARTVVNSGELPVYKPKTTYYLPIDMINTENGKRSPYGEFVDAYVVVSVTKDGYDYYWTSNDTTKTGILLTHYDDLNKNSIKNNVEKIKTDISICGNDNIVVFNSDGTIKEEKKSKECINPRDTYTGTTSVINSADFFDFDSQTNTINGIHDKVELELLDVDACAAYVNNFGWDADLEEIKEFCENDLEYFIIGEDDVAEDMKSKGIIEYTIEKYPRDAVIPSEIDGVEVTRINSYAFSGTTLNSIKLPNTLKRIEAYAFYNTGLKSIELTEGLTYIGNGAFYGNYFSKITIPSTVTNINSGAFFNCPLLYEVINKTNRGFNWTSVFGNYDEAHIFVTGTYHYSYDGYNYHNGNRYYDEPFNLTIYVTDSDSVNINIDSMFEIDQYTFNLKNNNGYKVYSYELSTDNYVENVPGPMNRVEGSCGELYSHFYIADKNDNILFQGFYEFHNEGIYCLK